MKFQTSVRTQDLSRVLDCGGARIVVDAGEDALEQDT